MFKIIVGKSMRCVWVGAGVVAVVVCLPLCKDKAFLRIMRRS